MRQDLLTSPEVAQLLDRSSRTVHRLVEDGKLTPVMRLKAGRNGTFLFDRADVDRLIAAESAAA